MAARMLRVFGAAAVAAGGLAVGTSAHAADNCGTQPTWNYTTTTMTASLGVAKSCYASRARISVSVQIQRCDAFTCTHSPVAARNCRGGVTGCVVKAHLDHGPVESTVYYIDASVSVTTGSLTSSTASRSVLTCTSAAVTASC